MKNEIIETTKLMPAMKIDEVVEAFDEYQKLRERLERDGDFIEFDTSQGKKKAPTKQWRVKLERFFGLSVEISKEWDTKEDDNSITYHKRARAIHNKSGLFHEATGACNTKEKIRTLNQIAYQIKDKHKDWSDDFIQARAKDILRDEISKAPHNAEAHAETRAKNRAVLEFVGFGEVSAEELSTSPEVIKEEIIGLPATEKQIKYISSYILPSQYLDPDEKMRLSNKMEKLTKKEASDVISWWIGDEGKGIEGERSKREKKWMSKTKEGKAIDKSKTDILEEITRLRRENFLTNDEYFYEELDLGKKLEEYNEEELKIILERLKNYIPDLTVSDEDIPQE